MTDDGLYVSVETAGPEGALVTVRGELDMHTAAQLADRLFEVIRQAPQRVVIDLAATSFMDCRGALPIAQARDRLPAQRCQVILRRPRPLARKVLAVMGLDGPCVIED